MSDTATLIKKLYLAKHKNIVLYNHDEYARELEALATDPHPVELEKAYDVIFVHVYTLNEMKNILHAFSKNQTIAPNGLCYIAYPKLNNPNYPGIHRDDIFPALEVDDALGLLPGTNYKFNRMVGLNDTFTLIGIKNVPEEKTKNTKPSARVGDYEKFIPEIIDQLKTEHPEQVELFKALTPGRQRNYARHIYSAKTASTHEKRFNQMLEEMRKT